MSTAVEATILNTLADTLDSYVTQNPVAVAYPGLAFVPPAGQPFLRPWLLPAPTLQTDMLRSNDYFGIFQVDVFWPAGQGIKPAVAAASKLIDFFIGSAPYYGDDFKVILNGAPYISPALQEPGWLQIPVNIRYRAFTQASGLLDIALAVTEASDSAAFAGSIT